MLVWLRSRSEQVLIAHTEGTEQTRCAYLVLKSMKRRVCGPRLMSRQQTTVETTELKSCAKVSVCLLCISDSTAGVGI